MQGIGNNSERYKHVELAFYAMKVSLITSKGAVDLMAWITSNDPRKMRSIFR